MKIDLAKIKYSKLNIIYFDKKDIIQILLLIICIILY